MPKKTVFFIHIPKTAGTFTRNLLRKNDNFFVDERHVFPFLPVINFGKNNKFAFLFQKPKNMVCYNIPNFNKFIRFTIVRNPYDLLYSYYSHDRRRVRKKLIPHTGWGACNNIMGHGNFEQFINRYTDSKTKWHIPCLKDCLFHQIFKKNGDCIANYAVRYERLEEGIKELGDICSMKIPEKFSGEYKENVNAAKKDYREAYTDVMRNKVFVKCNRELDMFRYNFDGPTDSRALIKCNGMKIV